MMKRLRLFLLVLLLIYKCSADEILGCGGFVKSLAAGLDFSEIEIGLYTKEGALKEKTECAPTNGYYFVPLYEKGEYTLKVHPPAGWSIEPSQISIIVDGVTDKCSTGQDLNFFFNGFGITGRVTSLGQTEGPSGVTVQLVDPKGEVRKTITAYKGDFHFTPVIPGKYVVRASHPRWQLEPSETSVVVKEGNTVLPTGKLVVKGYDVRGTVVHGEHPVPGVYVLLYSKEERPKYKISGCNTALLAGVPDAPICHSITDQSGEFNFGILPSGEYKLLALTTSSQLNHLSFNLKTETLPIVVKHDSLYIKNAFQVTGFSVRGVTSATGGRVMVDGSPVSVADSKGVYVLNELTYGTHTVGFEHEWCEVRPIQISISPPTPIHTLPKTFCDKIRVTGLVSPNGGTVKISSDDRDILVQLDQSGKWSTFLTPGTYTATVILSDNEMKDGLQFFPKRQKFVVSNSPIEGVNFSQLKATIRGRVKCLENSNCEVTVTLRSVSEAGQLGAPITTQAKDGKYEFVEVLPGSVEVSVPKSQFCWGTHSHTAIVTAAEVEIPTFEQIGYVVKVHSDYKTEIDLESPGGSKSTHSVAPGGETICVPKRGVYTLIPKGCTKFTPEKAIADLTKKDTHSVQLRAVGHAARVRVVTDVLVNDLKLELQEGEGPQYVGPLKGEKDGDSYVYEHTFYMPEEWSSIVRVISSSVVSPSPSLLRPLSPPSCSISLSLFAKEGEHRRGRVHPPMEGVLVTLLGDNIKLTQITGPDGKYSFGPLVKGAAYTISAQKDSYVMSAPDKDGNITADKLCELSVQVVDEGGAPIEEAAVSVSGGSFRSAKSSPALFTALQPKQYHVSAHHRDFKFRPKHHDLTLNRGDTHQLTIRGTRIAWRCSGRVVSLSGAGINVGAKVIAKPNIPTDQCLESEANINNGDFVLRGLLPECEYSLDIKPSEDPHSKGLKLAQQGPTVQVKDKKDISGIRMIAIQPYRITDTNVYIHANDIEHYKTITVKLLQEDNATPIHSTRLDSIGFSKELNPGLMVTMPRLPADNNTYVVQIESTLSKNTHSYSLDAFYFVSDGRFKHFDVYFEPKVKSTEQELRQSSTVVIPLLALVAAAFYFRDTLIERSLQMADKMAARNPAKSVKAPRNDIVNKAERDIDQIMNNINNPVKRQVRKKPQLIG